MTADKPASDDAVMDDVFATDRDRGGKSAPPEGKAPEPKAADTPPPEAKDKPPSSETTAPEELDESTLHPVPRGILKSEREKHRRRLEEESRARTTAETEARLYRERLSAYEQAQHSRQAPPQQQRQQEQPPDPVLEPEEFAAYTSRIAQQAAFVERLNNSEDRARDKFGDAPVDEALQAASQAGLLKQGAFIRANPRHPYGALMEWHKRTKVLQTVGDDPEAYRKRIEDDVRKQVLAELNAGGAPQGQRSGSVTRFPGTLADATAAGRQGGHLTDEAVMDSVFASGRKRK